MYPIGGYVFVREWIEPEHGPYEIANYYQLDDEDPQMYYDLHGVDVIYHFLEHEIRPATKAEELYHKLTKDLL